MRWSRSPSGKVSRRALLPLALGGVAGFGFDVEAAPRLRIAVEVPPGSGPVGAHFRQALTRHLAKELAARPPASLPAAARLVIRVSEIFISHDIGSRGRFGVPAMPDGADGEALVIDGRGRVILRKRVHGRSPISSGGLALSPHSEPRRVEALAANFAYWIAREFE